MKNGDAEKDVAKDKLKHGQKYGLKKGRKIDDETKSFGKKGFFPFHFH